MKMRNFDWHVRIASEQLGPWILVICRGENYRVVSFHRNAKVTYEGRTESHEQRFFACELGTADEGECGGRWNQLLCYP